MVSVDFLVEGVSHTKRKNHHFTNAAHILMDVPYILIISYNILSVPKQSVVIGRSLVIDYHDWT